MDGDRDRGCPSSLPTRLPRSDHVQAPCSWSANFSIGTGCAFDDACSSSNDEFRFNVGRPRLSPSCKRRKPRGLRRQRTTAADSIFRPAGIQRRGVYVQAIELAAVNAPIWQIKNVCLFNHRYLNDNSLQFSTTDHFVSGGFVLVKTIPSLTFCWLPRSSFPESYASSKLN
jgi:hypothetical protein